MRIGLFAGLAIAAAFPAWGQEATEGKVDSTFTWTARQIDSVPAGPDHVMYVVESTVIVTATTPNPFDRLAGRCLLIGKGLVDGPGEDLSTGTCKFVDPDGDILYEETSEENGIGKGVITGGTGKFSNLSGEYVYSTSWYGSVIEGVNQGFRTQDGTWKREAM